MPVLINQSGLAENLGAEESQLALQQGTHTVPLVSPEGQSVSAPHTEAQDWLSKGYKQPTPEQLQELVNHAKNQGLGEQAKAFGEAAASSLTLGASRAVEKAFGATEADMLRRRETGAATAGEIAGYGAGMLLGTGEAAIAEGAGAAMAGAIAKAGAKTVAGRIGTQAAKMAVETAVMAGRSEIDKAWLHDPEQTIGTAAANIGAAGLFGGVLGGGFGAGAELWSATAGKKLGGLLERMQSHSGGVDKATQEALGDVKLDAEIAGMASSPEGLRTGQQLREGATKAAKDLQAKYAENMTKISDAAAQTVGKAEGAIEELHEVSKAEIGKGVKESLAEILKKEAAPIAERYEALHEKFSGTALDAADKAAIADKVTAHIAEEGLDKGPNEEALKLANKFLDQLPKQETVQDLRKYAQGLSDAAPFGSEKYGTGRALRSLLTDAIDEKVGSIAGEEFRATQAEYGKFKGLLQELNDRLKLGAEGRRGVGSFVKALENSTPEEVINKLKLKGDTELQALLAEKFPTVSDAVKAHDLDQLLKKSLDASGKQIDLKKLDKAIRALEPEHRSALFTSEQLAKLDKLSELQRKLSERLGPSGTAKTIDGWFGNLTAGVGGMMYAFMGHNPLTGWMAGHLANLVGREIPDAGRLAMLKFMGSDAAVNAGAFAANIKLADKVLKGERAVSEAVKLTLKGSAVTSTDGLAEEREKLKKHLNLVSEQPEKLIDAAGSVGHYSPEHGTEISRAASNIAQYLETLKPPQGKQSPLDPEKPVNKALESKYNRALDIANRPLLVMDAAAKGQLTRQDWQHLQVMYPGLARSLQTKLGNEMLDYVTKGASVPHAVKQSLSIIMQQPMESSMQPQAILASQPPINMLPQARAHKPGIAGSKMTGLQKLPTMYQTPSEARQMHRRR